MPATASDEPAPAERRSLDKDRAAVDRCLRAGDVMSLLFPDGVQLTNGKDFAAYRLFDALVGSAGHFAQTGMVEGNALTAISRYATLLEQMVRPQQDASEPLNPPVRGVA